MKFFQNKNVLQKILIAVVLVVLLFSFIIPKRVYAIEGETLLQPIMSFFVGIGDGIMSIMQKVVLGMDNSIIEIDDSSNFWAKFFVVLGTALLCVAVIATAVLTGGTGIALAAAVLKAVAITAITIGTVTVTFPLLTTITKGMLPSDLSLPLYTLTPENIFSNKIPMLDVDFFSPTDYSYLNDSNLTDEDNEKNISIAYKLRPVISGWYVIIRNIAIVASLTILVYLGIRILISSSAADKSKYQQTMMDWVVSLCLIFCMHYIMAFSNMAVKTITSAIDVDSLNKSDELKGTEVYYISDSKDRVKNAYKDLVEEPAKAQNKDESEMFYYGCFVKAEKDDDGNVTSFTPAGDDADTLVWPAKNFLQQARLEAQINREKNKDDAYSAGYVTIGWKLIYCVLVVFTVIFLFTYIKRVVYMAFLTMIAPLVAMTYPLDKLNDGKAQAFDMWFKEYIFNLLIQPFHLILYTILVGSAFEFASKNVLYVIVCLSFIFPAEKLLRKFFGFEKAQTPGILNGPAGGALMYGATHRIFNRPPPPPLRGENGSGGKIGSGSSSSDDSGKIKTSGNMDAMIDDGVNSVTIGDGSTSTAESALNNTGGEPDEGDKTMVGPHNLPLDWSTGKEYDPDAKNKQIVLPDGSKHAISDENDNGGVKEDSSKSTPSESDSTGDNAMPEEGDNNKWLGDDELWTSGVARAIGRGGKRFGKAVKDSKGGKMVREEGHRLAEDYKKSAEEFHNTPFWHHSLTGRGIRQIKGFAAASGKALKYTGQRLKEPGFKGYAAAAFKGAGKVAFTGASTMAGATAGAIAGIASGDPSKFAQYTALGAAGAFTKAKNTHLPKFQTSPELSDAMNRARYNAMGKDYDEEMAKKKKREFVNDPNLRLKIEKNCKTKEEADEIMKHAGEYYDEKIFDPDLIKATHDLQKSQNMGIHEASNVARAAVSIGDTTNMSGKKQLEWRDTFVSRMKESDKYKSASAVDKKKYDKSYLDSADSMMSMINQIYKSKNDFK